MQSGRFEKVLDIRLFYVCPVQDIQKLCHLRREVVFERLANFWIDFVFVYKAIQFRSQSSKILVQILLRHIQAKPYNGFQANNSDTEKSQQLDAEIPFIILDQYLKAISHKIDLVRQYRILDH